MPTTATIPREWFESWREPGDFYRAADKGLEAFFQVDETPPHYLRDAYVAGAFARIWRDAQAPCEVRLVPKEEQFPDAQIRAGSKTLDFEITMADKRERPMFKIWRKLLAMYKRGQGAPVESVEEKRASAREAIPRVCAQKAAKHYTGRPNLLVYVNAGPVLSVAEMARLTEPWRGDFESIWLWCGVDAVCAWPTIQVLRGKEPF